MEADSGWGLTRWLQVDDSDPGRDGIGPGGGAGPEIGPESLRPARTRDPLNFHPGRLAGGTARFPGTGPALFRFYGGSSAFTGKGLQV